MKEFPQPYWSVPGASLYLGDACERLRQFPPRSVHCVVTSPPYWGLRDYGTAEWGGGDPSCDHSRRGKDSSKDYTSTLESRATNQNHEREAWSRGVCGKCGAVKIGDRQLGAEASPDCGTDGQAQCGACFVCNLVAVFREVHRVLRNDGSAWLNLGDTYASGGRVGHGTRMGYKQQTNRGMNGTSDPVRVDAGLPDGNLVGVPWRVALALQADGWVLRQDVIWHSPNKIPESVTNRCTKSHEHVFLLAKGDGYYFDAEAIAEPGAEPDRKRYDRVGGASGHAVRHSQGSMIGSRQQINKRDVWSADDEAALLQWLGANHPELLARFLKDRRAKSDVWVVSTKGYPGAHYATFSPRLIEPCILAGTSEHGCCAECGKPYERVVIKTKGQSVMDDGASRRTPQGQTPQSHHNGRKDRDRSFPSHRNGLPGAGSTLDGTVARRETAGWRKPCRCPTEEVLPAVVLDPFVGSGTTVATAILLGRYGIGVDLSEAYLREDAVPRIEAAVSGKKVGRKPTVAVPEDSPPPPRRLRQ